MKKLINIFYCKVIMALFMVLAVAIYVPNYNTRESAPRTVFLKLPNGQPEPQVKLSTSTNSAGQLFLEIKTDSFEFTQTCKTKSKEALVGHAHVMINGVKIGTAYDPRFDISHLQPGNYKVEVTLQGQDHRTLLGKNGIVGTSTRIQINREGDA